MAINENLFIDKYETIRQMLLQLFLYGCYDREQGAKTQKVSNSSYSENIKRIKYFWPEKLGANRKFTGKKINYFPFNRYKTNENYLFRSFEIKAFSMQEINLYFFILEALADGKSKTTSEIADTIGFYVFPITEQDAPIFYPMLNRILEEMCNAGFLYVAAAKPRSYHLASDILGNLSSSELTKLYRAISAYRDLLPLSSLGYRVQHIIHDVIAFDRGDDLPNSESVSHQKVFFQSILNDEIVYQIICAIESHHYVSFKRAQQGEIFTHVIPLKLIFDEDYGRQFLFASLPNGTTFIRRLDQISNFQLLNDTYEPANYQDATKILSNIWNASLYYSNIPRTLKKLQIDFYFSNDNRQYLQKRLIDEKRFGVIAKISNNHWIFQVTVFDTTELLPWIRSFGKYAHVRSESTYDVSQRLQNDWQILRNNYQTNIFNEYLKSNPRNTKRNSSMPVTDYPQPEIFSVFRNIYFRLIHQILCQMILDGKQFTSSELLARLQTNTSSSMKKKQQPNRLTSQVTEFHTDIKRCALFQKNAQGFLVPSYNFNESSLPENSCDPIPFLLMTEEKRWLKTLLTIPKVQSYLGKDLTHRLQNALTCPSFPFSNIIIHRGNTADKTKHIHTEEKIANEPMHLLIQPIHEQNDIERSFLLFSTFEKEGWLDNKTGLYHLLVYYAPSEKEELLSKVLSLGNAVLLLSPSDLRHNLLANIPS